MQRLEAHVAKNKLANDAALRSWLQTHTPKEIIEANFARSRLNTLEAYKKHVSALHDDRIPRRPISPWLLFTSQRLRTTDRSTTEARSQALKDIAAAWRALSDSERQVSCPLWLENTTKCFPIGTNC